MGSMVINLERYIWCALPQRTKGQSTRYDYRISFVFWRVKMNGDVSLPTDMFLVGVFGI
jgi:hypothetical protein